MVNPVDATTRAERFIVPVVVVVGVVGAIAS
jgi:hypothetical protein